MFTVRVALEFDEPGLTEHVGACAGKGCTEQVNETELLNPPSGVTVTTEVEPCPGAIGFGAGKDAAIEKSGGTVLSKFAVTSWSLSIVTVHDPVPEQGELQPAKLEPASAVALRVTAVPGG